MRNKTKTRLLYATAIVAVAATATFAMTHRPAPSRPRPQTPAAQITPTPSPTSVRPRYDLAALRHPDRDYFGVAIDGVPDSVAGLDRFADDVHKRPNLVAYFQVFGDSLDVNAIARIEDAQALPLIQLEPMKTKVSQIAAGSTDTYLHEYAQEIADLGMPIVLSFGHEMNGDWYPWGTQTTGAKDFVSAWQRMHDIFTQAGATNVIWMWNVNNTNPVPDVKLAPLFPGESYVDWIGLTGYFNENAAGGSRTFESLFDPTIAEVRAFTQKPFLIAETGASPGADKPNEMESLFSSALGRPDVVGFVWFNYHKTGAYESNWKVDSDPRSKETFARLVQDPRLGFPVIAQ